MPLPFGSGGVLLRLGDPRVRVPASVDAVALQRLEIAQAGALYALLQLGPLQDEGLELRCERVGVWVGVVIDDAITAVKTMAEYFKRIEYYWPLAQESLFGSIISGLYCRFQEHFKHHVFNFLDFCVPICCLYLTFRPSPSLSVFAAPSPSCTTSPFAARTPTATCNRVSRSF